jgi:transcription elongation GreA/GreB family factor
MPSTKRSKGFTTASTPRLTPGGYGRIAERIVTIRGTQLPEMLPLLIERERDERDVAEFERLMHEADSLEALLAEAQILADDPVGFEGRVDIGMRVHITLADGSEAWVRPVHPEEAFLDEERISVTSPLATALLGARASQVVWVAAPAGVWACTVLAIDSRVSE